MAQILLENVHPILIQKLEARANRLGTTLQAEALRLLQENLAEEAAASRPAERPSSPPHPVVPGEVTAAATEIPTESPYPAEYVLFEGSTVLFHSPHQREAFARYASAQRGSSEKPLSLMVPKPRARPEVPVVVRGRAVTPSSRERR